MDIKLRKKHWAEWIVRRLCGNDEVDKETINFGLNNYANEHGSELLNSYGVINWVAVSEKLPPRPDEDYLVCVRNKNKEGGIPIQDIGNFSSDGVWVKQNTFEDVVFWAELPKPPCL